MVIAKGKTKRTEKKFYLKDTDDGMIMHSQNGWMTAELMKTYLDWLSRTMGPGKIALVLDVYKAHVNEEVRSYADSKNIELIFVPACGTGMLQPLDIRIFGIVKEKLTEHQRLHPVPNNKLRFKYIYKTMINIWQSINKKAFKEAWDIPGLPKQIRQLKDNYKEEEEEDNRENTNTSSEDASEYSENIDEDYTDEEYKESLDKSEINENDSNEDFEEESQQYSEDEDNYFIERHDSDES